MPLKLLHVVPTYLPAIRYGGPIYTVHGLCRALAERGHEIQVFTTNVDGPGISEVPLDHAVALDGVAVRYFPTGLGRRLYRSPAMGRALNDSCNSFDLIHVHSVFLWPTLAGANTARKCKIPYIVTPRGMLVPELISRKSRWIKSAWINLFERQTLACAAAIHFTSDIEADDMRRLGLACRNSAVIPNGLDLARADESPSPDDVAWAGSLPQPFVLYLGRINWKKGLDRLITAMRFVDGITLVIAGNDEENYQRKLLGLANDQGVASKIQFTGHVSGTRKQALFKKARMLVLPSYSENFGMVVLEAMAAGCPVLVTPEVGLAETVKTSGAGLVVNGDPRNIAEVLTAIKIDKLDRERMGQAGRSIATHQFSWANVAAQMERLYLECAGRNP